MNTIDTPDTPSSNHSIWQTAIRYGGYCGALLVLIGLLTFLADLNLMSGMGMLTIYSLTLIATFTIAAMAIRYQRDQLDHGLISYGKALGVAFMVILIGMLISSVWSYIQINFIDPEYVGRLKDQFIASWGESMPEDRLEETLKSFDEAGTVYSTVKNGLIGGSVYGLIVGLITAAFLKREPKQSF